MFAHCNSFLPIALLLVDDLKNVHVVIYFMGICRNILGEEKIFSKRAQFQIIGTGTNEGTEQK